jgi:hypothetical protein
MATAKILQSDKMSVVWDDFLEPSIQQFTIDTAEQALREEVVKGFDRAPTVITDGAPRRDYHDVKPFGRIEFVSTSGGLLAAVNWILAELLLVAPTGRGPDKRPGHPGFYKGHFVVLQDMAEVTDLTTLRPGRIIHIVNTAVYAAKLEGRDAATRWRTAKGNARSRRSRRAAGWSAKQMQGSSRQTPNGIFNVVWKAAKQRYSRTLDIDYGPVQLNLGVTVIGQASRRNRRRVARQQVYPAIRIFQRPDPTAH